MHKWQFFKSARCVQAKVETGDDLLALKELDKKLWTVLAAPTTGVRFDEATLKLLDADGDGRVRVPEVLAAVDLLSHDPGVPYLEYVASVAENELARRVKVADLRHNCDLTRLDAPTERDRERISKYHKALEVLGEHV